MERTDLPSGGGARYAVRFTNLVLLSAVVGRGPGARRHIPPALYLLGLIALLVSLARLVAVLAVPREQSAVMLVMDVSGSMAADDLQPSRMEAAKQAAHSFVSALPHARSAKSRRADSAPRAMECGTPPATIASDR